MNHLKWALINSKTFLSSASISYLMTGITEVSSPKAEPDSFLATVPAFKFYPIFSMLLAISNSSSHLHSWARTTDQVFRFEILLHFIILLAVNHSTIVRTLTLEAFEECKSKKWKLFHVAIKRLLRKAFIIFKAFYLCSFKSFLFNVLIKFPWCLELLFKLWAIICL